MCIAVFLYVYHIYQGTVFSKWKSKLVPEWIAQRSELRVFANKLCGNVASGFMNNVVVQSQSPVHKIIRWILMVWRFQSCWPVLRRVCLCLKDLTWSCDQVAIRSLSLEHMKCFVSTSLWRRKEKLRNAPTTKDFQNISYVSDTWSGTVCFGK